jgi:hypothetical protein
VLLTLRPEREENLLPAACNLLPFTVPSKAVTVPELIELAYRLHTTIAGAGTALRAIYSDAVLPVLPDDRADSTVPWMIRDVLIDDTGPVTSWRLGAFSIVEGAMLAERPLGDFLGMLDPYRFLGAPVPRYDEETRELLNRVKADKYDLDMLQLAEGTGSKDLETVTSLGLVHTAGRFGWTLAEAHERFARLVPIGLTLDYPQESIPDEIVYWYDLLALTAYFDGQAPVISGRIDWAYLKKAAEEIFDCAVAEIPAKAVFLRDRLRIYARLFELELPEETPSA